MKTKVDETNAMINMLGKNVDMFPAADFTNTEVSCALLDIAKSLAIIADSLATLANDKEVNND